MIQIADSLSYWHPRQVPARLTSRARTLWLYALVFAFYAANVYNQTWVHWIGIFKWITAVGVFVVFLTSATGQLRRQFTLDATWLAFAVLILAIPVIFSQDLRTSAEFYAGIVLLLGASWLVARHYAAVGAEEAFFDVIANIGQPIIVLSLIMWGLHRSLGRGGDRFSAWTDNPNTLGLILAPTIIILIGRLLDRQYRRRRVTAALTLAGLFLLVETGSRASILFVVVGAIALVGCRKGFGPVFWVAIVTATLAAAWWNTIQVSVVPLFRHRDVAANVGLLSGRLEVWPVGVDYFKSHPVFGVGPGLSKDLLETWHFKEAQAAQFHNSYLTILVEFGLVGAAILASVLLTAIFIGARRVVWSRQGEPKASLRWALPWSLLLGGLAHAFFETWVLSPGNANMFTLWVCIWFLACRRRRVATVPADPRLACA